MNTEQEFFAKAGSSQPTGFSYKVILAICGIAIVVGAFGWQHGHSQVKPVETPTVSAPNAQPVDPVSQPASAVQSTPLAAVETPPPDGNPLGAEKAVEANNILIVEKPTADDPADALTPEQQKDQFVKEQHDKGLVLYRGEWMTSKERVTRRAADDAQKQTQATPNRNYKNSPTYDPSADSDYAQDYGETSKVNGLPRTHLINGYTRKDGTVVRPYYRSK